MAQGADDTPDNFVERALEIESVEVLAGIDYKGGSLFLKAEVLPVNK